MPIDSLVDRVSRSIAQRGLIGTGQMCWGSLLALMSPASRNVEAARRQVDEAFDQEHEVDTRGIVRPRSGTVIGKNWAYGVSYQAIDPAAFVQAMQQTPIPYADFTFVDYGSGKGRALLLAARFPFKRIIGVEYCEKLNEIARKNLERHGHSSQPAAPIEIVHADAVEYVLPQGPLVLYLYNPFGRPVMASVVKNVIHSFNKAPRRMVVIYFTPWFENLWAETGFLKRLQSSPAIFDTGPVGQNESLPTMTTTE